MNDDQTEEEKGVFALHDAVAEWRQKEQENIIDATLVFQERTLAHEVDKLRAEFFSIGLCPDCRTIIWHDLDEPFFHCECGGGTWDGPHFPHLQQILLKYDALNLALDNVREELYPEEE